MGMSFTIVDFWSQVYAIQTAVKGMCLEEKLKWIEERGKLERFVNPRYGLPYYLVRIERGN